MDDHLPAHAIMSTMCELAEQVADAPLESLCIALANFIEDPRIQADEDLMGQLVLFGAGLWRHTGEYKRSGSQTLQ